MSSGGAGVLPTNSASDGGTATAGDNDEDTGCARRLRGDGGTELCLEFGELRASRRKYSLFMKDGCCSSGKSSSTADEDSSYRRPQCGHDVSDVGLDSIPRFRFLRMS